MGMESRNSLSIIKESFLDCESNFFLKESRLLQAFPLSIHE